MQYVAFDIRVARWTHPLENSMSARRHTLKIGSRNMKDFRSTER